MAEVTIDVTADDIAHGLSGDCVSCPVARAAARVLGIRAHVGPDTVAFGEPHVGQVELDLPQRAADFIRRFDDGIRVEPFSFVLDVPDELIPQEATS